MKLRGSKNWNVFAGGTCAASDRNSYSVETPNGKYMIQPVSSEYDVERHLGYKVWFINSKGRRAGGLWQELSDTLVSLPLARHLCHEHNENFHDAAA